jgi:citrate (Re)-synthase
MTFSRTTKGYAKGFGMIETREPELYRQYFPYSSVPRIVFDGKIIPPDPAPEIWITDTTFRDGQQARPPYTPKQIVDLYTLLHRLGGETGVIRQSEFFLYSKRDREAVQGCLDLGFAYPEVSGWIRAHESDIELVKGMGLKETGILTSVSDYHIFLKLKTDRRSVTEKYLSIVRSALDAGVRPRCHFEDVTRADIYGFCLPFAEELLRLMDDSGIPIKIRLCDTLGYGISYPGAALPRSVPKLVHAFRSELGYPAELLEWHGHNDFHKVHTNAGTAWLYGASALNASLLGFGERTGNPPLEAAIIEYIGLTGSDEGIDTTVITEIADYYRNEIRADVPPNYPFVGSEFNVTRAGIHADGLLKNQEIYNIFDTGAILNRPLRVMVTDKSGIAGVARWLNENVSSITDGTETPLNKRHPGVKRIAAWVSAQYENGRTTSISTEELIAQAKHYVPSLFESDFSRVRAEAMRKGQAIADRISGSEEIHSEDTRVLELFLTEIVKEEGSIQLLAVTDTQGHRVSQVHTQRGEKGMFRNLLSKNFQEKEWFAKVLGSGEAFYSDLFFSKYTGALIFTAALPVIGKLGEIQAVVDIDFKFEELVKLIGPIPDEILQSDRWSP